MGNVIRFQLDNNNQRVESPSISERMRLSQQSSSLSPTSTNGPTYARVYRQPASDELDFHLQGMNKSTEQQQSDRNVRPSDFLRLNYSSDINPSRGNIDESESELDIAQLENSVSPISVSDSPVNESHTTPSKSAKGPGQLIPETDF